MNGGNHQSLKALFLKDPVSYFDFHSSEKLILCALSNGILEVFKYSNSLLNQLDSTSNGDAKSKSRSSPFKHLNSFSIHDGYPCRQFITDGQDLISVSSNKEILFTSLEKSATSKGLKDAHDTCINCIYRLETHLISTGDENGTIKIWDERALDNGAVLQFSDHIDYVSDFAFHKNKKTLISSSGDGFINVYDIRKNKIKAYSECLEQEIHNLNLIKNNCKLVCGMDDGSLNIFSWDLWSKPTDKFILASGSGGDELVSIDSTLVLNESTLCIGSSDGLIKSIHIHPSKFLGVLANTNTLLKKKKGHVSVVSNKSSKKVQLPINHLSLSKDSLWIASHTGQEKYLYFWNGHVENKGSFKGSFKDSLKDANKTLRPKTPLKASNNSLVPSQKQQSNALFFADLLNDNESNK